MKKRQDLTLVMTRLAHEYGVARRKTRSRTWAWLVVVLVFLVLPALVESLFR